MCNSDKILAEVSLFFPLYALSNLRFDSSKFVSTHVYEMRAQMNASRIEESEKSSMLQRLLQYRYTPDVQMPDNDIISECIGHLYVSFNRQCFRLLSSSYSVAGTDTTSISIAFFLWELSRRPDIVQSLRNELDDIMPDRKVLPDITALNELPYLNAFMKEGV